MKMKISKFISILFIFSLLLFIIVQKRESFTSMGDDIINEMEEDPNKEREIDSLLNEEKNYESRHLSEDENVDPNAIEDGYLNPGGISTKEALITQDSSLKPENLGGVEQFMSNSEGQEASEEEGEINPEHFLINLNYDKEVEKLKNFKQISKDMETFEENYKNCLQKIPAVTWTEKEIEKCVGPDFTEIVNDISKLINF